MPQATKVTFDNSWMALYAMSMSKLHLIQHMVDNEVDHDRLFKKGFITVAGGSSTHPMQLLAEQYGAKNKSSMLANLSTESKPYLELYIKSDKNYFQVGFVSSDEDECNRVMMERNDLALMATDNHGFYYLASLEKAK